MDLSNWSPTYRALERFRTVVVYHRNKAYGPHGPYGGTYDPTVEEDEKLVADGLNRYIGSACRGLVTKALERFREFLVKYKNTNEWILDPSRDGDLKLVDDALASYKKNRAHKIQVAKDFVSMHMEDHPVKDKPFFGFLECTNLQDDDLCTSIYEDLVNNIYGEVRESAGELEIEIPGDKSKTGKAIFFKFEYPVCDES